MLWTTGKTTYECKKEYLRVVNGWDDAVLMPIHVIVIDADGYADVASRMVPVRFSQKAR